MTRIAEIVNAYRRGTWTRNQAIALLAMEGIHRPEQLLDDPNIPDTSSVGFESRAAVHIERSPLTRRHL